MKSTPGRSSHRQRGFALLVLWTMVLLSLIGTRVAATAGLVADNVLLWRFLWARPGMNDPALSAYKVAGLAHGPAGAPCSA